MLLAQLIGYASEAFDAEFYCLFKFVFQSDFICSEFTECGRSDVGL
jgi:hypothetical protein